MSRSQALPLLRKLTTAGEELPSIGGRPTIQVKLLKIIDDYLSSKTTITCRIASATRSPTLIAVS